jgi:hypothetical protein
MRFGVVLSIENYLIACSFVRLSLSPGVGPRVSLGVGPRVSLGVGPSYDIDVYRLCLQK